MKPLPKTIINFWLDAFMLLVFVALIWVTAVQRFAFPPATAADGWLLWNLDYNHWADLQFAFLCLFAFSVLIHVMLHWSWVCGVVAGKFLPRRDGKRRVIEDGTRTIWGVGLLIAILNLLGFALAAALLSIQSPS